MTCFVQKMCVSCHLEKSLGFVKIFFVRFSRSFGGLCATSPLVSNLQSQSSLTLFTIFLPQNDKLPVILVLDTGIHNLEII